MCQEVRADLQCHIHLLISKLNVFPGHQNTFHTSSQAFGMEVLLKVDVVIFSFALWVICHYWICLLFVNYWINECEGSSGVPWHSCPVHRNSASAAHYVLQTGRGGVRQVPTHTVQSDAVIFHTTPQNNISRENWQADCTIVVTHPKILTAFCQQQESSNNSIIGLNGV